MRGAGSLTWAAALLVLGGAGLAPKASTAPPVTLTPETRKEFTEKLLPGLEKYCLDCHSGAAAAGGFDLDEIQEPEALVANAPLLEKMIQYLRGRSMPPANMPQPTEAERKALVEGLERFFAANCQPADAGRVTIRRLNRFEYTNTVNDLFGMTFNVSDDFPNDDVGYGFDNNGDVLTMSTLHLEKYLAAAEKIAAEVLPVSQPRTIAFDFSKAILPESVRVVEEDAMLYFANGSVPFRAKIETAGAYTLALSLGAHPAGPEPPQAVVKLNGRALAPISVKSARGARYEVEIPVDLRPMELEIRVDFVNDYYNPNHPDQNQRDRNLLVYSMSLTGPKNAAPITTPGRTRLLVGLTGTGRTLAESALQRFAERAYRRPLQPGEIQRIMALYDQATRDGAGSEEALQVAVTGVLVSPHFLFRAELDEQGEPNTAIGAHELASRLSYFLWGSFPDDALRRAAQDGSLLTDAGLTAQVDRMLKDPRAARLGTGFAGQWLQLRKLSEHEVDPNAFPSFTPSLRTAMIEEIERFFNRLVATDRPVREILTSDETMVNGELARHYGLRVTGESWQAVTLPKGSGGLLTRAAFLTVTSNPNRTSPVKRGRFVLDNLLGTPLPPPPPDVGAIAEDAKAMTEASVRERMEIHRRNPACASCHSVMDPIGFSLENYDGIGRWRETDGPHPIDPSGEFPDGAKFAGVSGLKNVLLKREDELVRYLGERMLTYAIGRGMRPSDHCHLDAIRDEAKRRGGTMKGLITAVVLSDPFRKRSPSALPSGD